MSKSEMALRLVTSGAAVIAGSAGLAQAQDVGGFYGGVGISMPSGDGTFYGGSDTYSIDNGALGSIFGGYNVVTGSGLVYGGELALTQGGTIGGDGYYSDTFKLGTTIDLKARVGKVFGTTLVYGALGYSKTSIEDEYGYDYGDVDGVSIGAGFEMPISDNGFIGGDVTKRNLNPTGSGQYGIPTSEYVDGVDLTTVSVRLGFRF